MRRVILCSAAALGLIGAGLATGCGGDDSDNDTTTAAQTTGGTAPAAGAVEITMDDYSYTPKDATAPAGSTTINAPNVGQVEHELVLFKSDLDPAALPTTADGGVDEEKLDKVAEEVGEIPDVEAGDTGSAKFDLKSGKYVMFCNLPGHYAQGMYGSVTVE